MKTKVFPDSSLCSSSSEVSLLKVLNTSRVNCPEMTFSISCSASLDKTVIERKIVSDRVPPARAPVSEVGEVVQHVLVDVGQHQLLLGAAEDGHADQAYVGVLGLWLLWKGNPEQSWIQFSHGEHC